MLRPQKEDNDGFASAGCKRHWLLLNCRRNFSRRFQLQETSDRPRSGRPKVITARQDAYRAYVNAFRRRHT